MKVSLSSSSSWPFLSLWGLVVLGIMNESDFEMSNKSATIMPVNVVGRTGLSRQCAYKN
jgi:hypothetical protein